MSYKMPADVRKALKTWTESEFPRNAANVANDMRAHLEKQDDEDATYLLDKGWWRVYDEAGSPPTDEEDDMDQEEFDFDDDDDDDYDDDDEEDDDDDDVL